jgi:hypothetical protein
VVIDIIIMDILLNIRLKLVTEGMLCCELQRILPVQLRKDNSFKSLPVGKLAEILALHNSVGTREKGQTHHGQPKASIGNEAQKRR